MCLLIHVWTCALPFLANGGILPPALCGLLGDCREGARSEHRGHRQAKVSGPRRHHSGSVPDDHQETHPAAAGEGPFHDGGLGGAYIQVGT